MAKTGVITITLEQAVPGEEWEQIEMHLVQTLYEHGYRGSLENSVTNHIVEIQDNENNSLEDEY